MTAGGELGSEWWEELLACGCQQGSQTEQVGQETGWAELCARLGGARGPAVAQAKCKGTCVEQWQARWAVTGSPGAQALWSLLP